MTAPATPEPPAPGGPPPAAPATPPAPPAAPPAPPANPEEPDWLPARLQRHERSLLKKLGFESNEAMQERLAQAKKLEEQEEERKKASMTELERERGARQTAETERDRLKAEKETAERATRLVEACAEKGVKNVAYARFLVDAAMKANATLTEAAALDEYLKKDDQRIALGVASVPPTPAPLTATPPLPGTPPGAAPPLPNGPPSDAMTMDAKAWAAQKQAYGLR